jgi:hypothetical protein
MRLTSARGTVQGRCPWYLGTTCTAPDETFALLLRVALLGGEGAIHTR